ncbi:MAG: hypothetical protein ACO31E_06635, partial [Phycisphaerales bacterium]
ALALHGALFSGAPVRVSRPNDYNPVAAAHLGSADPDPGLNLAAVGLSNAGASTDGGARRG